MMWRKSMGIWLRVIVCFSFLWIAIDDIAAASVVVSDQELPSVTTTLTSIEIFSTTGVISGTLLAPPTTLTLTVQVSSITPINSPSTVVTPVFSSWTIPVSIPADVSGTLPFTLTMYVGAFETSTQQMSASIILVTPEPSEPPLAPTPLPTSTSPPTTPTAMSTSPSVASEDNGIVLPSDSTRRAGQSWLQALPLPGLWLGGIVVIAIVTIILLLYALRRRKLKNSRRTAVAPTPPSLIPDNVPLRPVPEKVEVRAAYLTFPGDMSQRFMLVPGGTTIGRAEDNVLVVDATFPAWETVSTYHARIIHLDNAWRLEDLDSHNGVYVNGQRTGRNLLRDGWEIGIGDLKFTFHIEGA